MASPQPIIELDEATKTFGPTIAVDRLTLAIAPGQIFGLIGPSGCGKTTTIRLLLGILRPTSGRVSVFDREPRGFGTRERERIGYASQNFFLYPTLTAYENVRFVASLYGIGMIGRRRRIKQVMQFLELWDVRRRLARDLSGGMQRRLLLGTALVHQPELLFVDEPTAGLDPLLREKIWNFLRQLRDNGITVFVTTQYIEETEQCDNVGVLDGGHLIAVGSPSALRRKALGGEMVDVKTERTSPEVIDTLRQLPQVKGVRWGEDGAVRVLVEDAATATPAITETLRQHGALVEAVRPVTPEFEEVFKEIVGNNRR